MLNVNEIRNLENSWKKYKRKKYLLYLPIFGIFIAIILFYFLFFYKFHVINKNNCNFSNKHCLISDNNKQNSDISLKKEKNITIKKRKKINYNNDFKVLSLNTKFLNHIYANKNKNIPKKNKISKKIIENKTIKTKSNNITKPTTDKHISKKQIILISSQKLDRIDYYKEKYFNSGKIVYANLISQIFYNEAKYKKSLKWAIIANNIDSLNEKSWILFAKSKVKIGQKQDAINALEAYLRFNKSKKISLLLSNIKNGVMK